MKNQPSLGQLEEQVQGNERILVVDDDCALRQTVQLVLENEGFAVKTAMNGMEAIEQAELLQPAAIVLDMGLPLLNGEEVAKELQMRYIPAIPIVLMTADGHAKEKGQRIGAVVALSKPFDIDDLVHAVYQALASKGRN